MDVNKFKLLQNNDNQYQIVLPIQTDNFYLGLDMGIDEIESQVIKEVKLMESLINILIKTKNYASTNNLSSPNR